LVKKVGPVGEVSGASVKEGGRNFEKRRRKRIEWGGEK
jgi:hypothetical protein